MNRQLAASAVLLCALLPPAFAKTVKPQRFGEWEVVVEKDPITDEKTVTAIIPSTPRDGSWMRLSCIGKIAGIEFYNPSVKFSKDDRVAIVLRADDKPPIKAMYPPAAGTGLVGARLSRGTYTMVSSAQKIAIRMYQEDGAWWSKVFSSTQTSAALRALIDACPVENASDVKIPLFDPSAPIFEPRAASRSDSPSQAPKPAPEEKPTQDPAVSKPSP